MQRDTEERMKVEALILDKYGQLCQGTCRFVVNNDRVTRFD